MKAPAVFPAILALALGSAAATAAASPVTLSPSTLTFKQAAAACNGALGTVTFALGHARIASSSGVSEQIDTTSSGIDTATFADNAGKSATVVADGHKRTVSAKNVQVKWKNQLACIMPD